MGPRLADASGLRASPRLRLLLLGDLVRLFDLASRFSSGVCVLLVLVGLFKNPHMRMEEALIYASRPP